MLLLLLLFCFSWKFFLFTYDTLQYNTLLTILLTYTTTTLPTNYIHYFRYLQSWLLTKLQYFPYIIQISFFYNLYYYFTIVHVWTYSSLFPIWNTNSLDLIKHERKTIENNTPRGLITMFELDYFKLNSQFSIAFLSYL